MKVISGDFKCDICQDNVSLIVKIRIVKSSFGWPVTSVVCIHCLTKEFYYLDDDNTIKFNSENVLAVRFNCGCGEVETTISSSLSKKLGIK